MPAALAVGGLGRKGSYQFEAREADYVGCTCALSFYFVASLFFSYHKY